MKICFKKSKISKEKNFSPLVLFIPFKQSIYSCFHIDQFTYLFFNFPQFCNLKYLTATLIHKANKLSGIATNLHLNPKNKLSPFDNKISLHLVCPFSYYIMSSIDNFVN
jgi:hypothetical protein